MFLRILALSVTLLTVSANPFLVDGPPMFPRDNPEDAQESPVFYPERRTQEIQEDPWTEMTIIKTHYDCGGFPMWREVSRVKSREGRPVEVVTTRKETLTEKGRHSATSEKAMFFKSMSSRLRIATAGPTLAPALEHSTSTAPLDPRPTPPAPGMLELGPDRIIDTPAIVCPEGYNEDYNHKCRPVFPY